MGNYNKQRLFEMMNRINGISLINETSVMSNLPPGISDSDFMPLDDYIAEVPCDTNSDINEDNPLDFGAKLNKVNNIQKLLANKDTEIKDRHQNYNTGGRIHSKTINDIKIDNEKFDIEKLKRILKYEPKMNQYISQNKKMGKSNFYNITLPAFKGLVYNQSNDEFYVVTVCTKAGECLKDCYAQMGRYIMFDAIIRLNTQKLNYLLNHWTDWKERMIHAIKTISFDGGAIIRWHDSGDFLSEKYLQIAFEIAKATPNNNYYAYSKEVSMILKSEIPRNFEFKFSYGGTEDSLINPTEHGHARVIPDELFTDLQPKETGNSWEFTPESIEILKDRIATKYGIDRNVLLTNKEISEIPYNKNDKHIRKWIVINWTGNNDIPALRKDVLAVYNLKHR